MRFRCNQTRQVRAVVGCGVGSFVQAKRIRRGLCVAGTTSSSRITGYRATRDIVMPPLPAGLRRRLTSFNSQAPGKRNSLIPQADGVLSMDNLPEPFSES